MPTEAHAQQEYSYFSAYTGYTNGGDTTSAGATFGFSTAFIYENNWGAEVDVSHSTKFNDAYEATGLTTAMLNIVAIPRVSRWARPYGSFGGGVIRARGCSTAQCVTEFSRTDFGLNAAGGVFVPVNDVFAARADVRYFRYGAVHPDVPRLGNGAFNFWRVTFGGVIMW